MKSYTSSNGANCLDVSNPDGDMIVIHETEHTPIQDPKTTWTTRKSFTHLVAGIKSGQFDQFCDTVLLEELVND